MPVRVFGCWCRACLMCLIGCGCVRVWVWVGKHVRAHHVCVCACMFCARAPFVRSVHNRPWLIRSFGLYASVWGVSPTPTPHPIHPSLHTPTPTPHPTCPYIPPHTPMLRQVRADELLRAPRGGVWRLRDGQRRRPHRLGAVRTYALGGLVCGGLGGSCVGWCGVAWYCVVRCVWHRAYW